MIDLADAAERSGGEDAGANQDTDPQHVALAGEHRNGLGHEAEHRDRVDEAHRLREREPEPRIDLVAAEAVGLDGIAHTDQRR